ncbi:MAG TPA: hypothetical protein VFC05_06605 [Nitrososphaeraceae archaeon]|nr:hypothetical protein [Nitrososphaeraceae archaeon]
MRDIASDYIEAQKQVIGSFQSQVERNSRSGVWDLYNPQKKSTKNCRKSLSSCK